MRLALNAQSRRRATIKTLAEIKNPKPVTFVQQADIANGPQQVAQRPTGGDPARGEILKSRKATYWRSIMANGWTPERQAAQSAAIRQWRPWEHYDRGAHG